MSIYTIKEVRGPGDYSTDSGQDAMVVVEGPDAPNTPVALFVRNDSSIAAGEQVFGSITQNKHGFRLKRQPREGAQRSHGGSFGDDPGRFDRKPEHPHNEARMRHTSALSAAPIFYDQMRTEGVLPPVESKDAYLKTITGIIEWLEGTYPQT